jgi:hypothetical protein
MVLVDGPPAAEPGNEVDLPRRGWWFAHAKVLSGGLASKKEVVTKGLI